MKLSEKELENYILNNEIFETDGFELHQQISISPYGVIDILGIKYPSNYDINLNLKVFELKINDFHIDYLTQLYRYVYGIKQHLQKENKISKKLSQNNSQIIIQPILICSYFDEIGDSIFIMKKLASLPWNQGKFIIDKLTIIGFEYSLKEGMYFEYIFPNGFEREDFDDSVKFPKNLQDVLNIE